MFRNTLLPVINDLYCFDAYMLLLSKKSDLLLRSLKKNRKKQKA